MSPRSSTLEERRSPVIASAVSLTVLFLATACGIDTSPRQGFQGLRATGQPLSASAGRGASGVDAPQGVKRAYSATFGSFNLCQPQAGAPPVISGVTLHAGRVSPIKVAVLVREISPRFVRSHPNLEPQALIPMAFGLGSAPEFREPYAARPTRGHYVPLAGYRVDETCAQDLQATDDLNTGKVPTTTTGELMLVVTSSESGSSIRSFDINYTAGGKHYSLPVRWSLINCGTEVTADC
jgi:hypothetical protein